MTGKRVGSNLYIHKDAIGLLDQEYVELVKEAAIACILSDTYNVLKIDLKAKKVSFLKYDAFFDDPFPKLSSSHAINLNTGKASTKRFHNSANPPILHRKELLIIPTHPKYHLFANLTRAAESYALFEESKKIGFKNYWEQLLKKKGLVFDKDQYTLIKKHSIDRHKTALTRYELSLPVKLLLKHKMLHKHMSFFDYGCGKGSDVELLQLDGYEAIRSFDPYYFPKHEKSSADVINLGYVLNVIEDYNERTFVLNDAFRLADQLLAVSVMTESQNNTPDAKSFNDGVLTQSNTFQKYYTQGEIKRYIDTTLDVYSIPVAQGIFFVFKDAKLQENFLLNKFKNHFIEEIIFENRLPRLKRLSQHEKRFLHVKEEMTQLWQDTIDQGRLLEADEINDELYSVLGVQYSSLKRMYKAAFENFEIEEFEESSERKKEDLITYFALTQFKKPLRFSDYDRTFQRDIKAHLTNHKEALATGKEALFDIGNKAKVIQAVAEASHQGLGYMHNMHSYMFHSAILDLLPPILRIYIYSATWSDPDFIDTRQAANT